MKIKISILISIILISYKAESQAVFFNAPISTIHNQIKHDKYKTSINTERNIDIGYIQKLNYQWDGVVSLKWLTASNNSFNTFLNSNTYNRYSYVGLLAGIRQNQGITKRVESLAEFGFALIKNIEYLQNIENTGTENKFKNNGTSLGFYGKIGVKIIAAKKFSVGLLLSGYQDINSNVYINNKKIKLNINQLSFSLYKDL